MTEIKLKPCPFCGCKDVAIYVVKYSGSCESLSDRRYFYCECMDCDARTGDNFDEDVELDMISSGKERAAFMWNIRVDKEA